MTATVPVRPGKSAKPAVAVVIVSAAVDALLVLVFVVIGRASHRENLLGTLTTLWPFLVGLTAGWLVARAWRSPRRIVVTGLIVWAVTVILGMVLRVVSAQGIEPSFVIVASVVLAVFLLGWRAGSVLVVKVLSGT